jgi:Kef-type K+ transport systems, predicted NAD-binding component
MYLVEGEAAGFDNIPRSIYWAIVTLTTVGYGDISPITNLGQSIAAIIMIMGYGLIAVPTGIVTSEITFATRVKRGQKCVVCNRDRIRRNAKFCSDCGSKLVKNN